LLVDRAAITDVTIRYCWALDTKDWAVLDSVFTEDANGDLLEDVVGRVAIKKRVETALSHMDETQHLISNHQIVVQGDTATCRCYLQAQHVRKAAHGGPNFIIAGRYEDELKRTPEGWRISFRRLVVMWTDGNPAVSRG
jgi:3-phenylpropionate/cinnamic acid dioxygenase small subunit